MALSEDLKKIYNANPVSMRHYDTVELSHSLFTKTYYLVRDNENHDWKLENDSTVTFEAFGFDVKLPEVGSDQQDMAFQFDNTMHIPVSELELAAENISEPIKLKYRVYADGFDTPQSTAINLVLTNIVVTNTIMSAVAIRPDLYARQFPAGDKITFDERFKGLYL